MIYLSVLDSWLSVEFVITVVLFLKCQNNDDLWGLEVRSLENKTVVYFLMHFTHGPALSWKSRLSTTIWTCISCSCIQDLENNAFFSIISLASLNFFGWLPQMNWLCRLTACCTGSTANDRLSFQCLSFHICIKYLEASHSPTQI